MYDHVFRKHSVFMVLVFILLVSSLANAKSLYVLRHGQTEQTRKILAFEIVGDQLIYQAQVIPTPHGFGPVDITIDDDSNILFLSYEYNGGDTGRTIELFSARTLENLGNEVLDEINGPRDVTGLAYDHARKRLYCTDRGKQKIYAYDWDSENLTLTAVAGSPFDISDQLTYNAVGFTFTDENLLYVSDFSTNPEKLTGIS